MRTAFVHIALVLDAEFEYEPGKLGAQHLKRCQELDRLRTPSAKLQLGGRVRFQQECAARTQSAQHCTMNPGPHGRKQMALD